MSDSLGPHESQHARPPCPSPTPGVYSNSCPSSQWCHPAISSSVIPFSSCPQSLPASEVSFVSLSTNHFEGHLWFDFLDYSLIFLPCKLYTNGIFCVWLLLLNFVRFTHVMVFNYSYSFSLKDALLKKSYDNPRQHIKKQRHHFANKGPYSQRYGFSSSRVQMWELYHKEGWAPKNWCFQTVVLEKALESPLDSKSIRREINPEYSLEGLMLKLKL